MNVQPEITYDYLVSYLSSRIARLEKQLSDCKTGLDVIKNNPALVSVIARLVRSQYYD